MSNYIKPQKWIQILRKVKIFESLKKIYMFWSLIARFFWANLQYLNFRDFFTSFQTVVLRMFSKVFSQTFKHFYQNFSTYRNFTNSKKITKSCIFPSHYRQLYQRQITQKTFYKRLLAQKMVFYRPERTI